MSHTRNSEIVEAIIHKFAMQPLQPEGGYWCPVYRSSFQQDFCVCGSILYLMTKDSFSHFHCLTSDEIFHFCAGDAVEQIIIKSKSEIQITRLGSDLINSDLVPMSIVPANSWQAAKLLTGGEYALLAATTIPGYTDDCIKYASAKELAEIFQEYKEDILRFL